MKVSEVKTGKRVFTAGKKLSINFSNVTAGLKSKAEKSYQDRVVNIKH